MSLSIILFLIFVGVTSIIAIISMINEYYFPMALFIFLTASSLFYLCIKYSKFSGGN